MDDMRSHLLLTRGEPPARCPRELAQAVSLTEAIGLLSLADGSEASPATEKFVGTRLRWPRSGGVQSAPTATRVVLQKIERSVSVDGAHRGYQGGGTVLSLVGKPDALTAALLRYHVVGINRFIITGYDPIGDARYIGRELLPRLKAGSEVDVRADGQPAVA